MMFVAVAFVPTVLGQDAAPQAVLISEAGETNCEDEMSLADEFFSELTAHPDDKGLIVITGRSDNLIKGLLQENTLRAWANFRRFPKDRFEILHGELQKRVCKYSFGEFQKVRRDRCWSRSIGL